MTNSVMCVWWMYLDPLAMKAQNESKAHKMSRVIEMYRFIVGIDGSLGSRLIRMRACPNVVSYFPVEKCHETRQGRTRNRFVRFGTVLLVGL